MKPLILNAVLLALLCIATLSSYSQTFPISYFEAADVQAILAQQGCDGIRVYPVVNGQTNSTMIIGIDAQGNEIYSESSNASMYHMFSGVSDNRPVVQNLNRGSAQSACSNYNSKYSAFVSDFNTASINGSMEGQSSGLSLTYNSANGNNFSASGYSGDSGIHSTGSESPGDPCPTACGDPAQYVCPPN